MEKLYLKVGTFPQLLRDEVISVNHHNVKFADAEIPHPVPADKIIRSILADRPRVTRFNIEDWS